MLIIREPNENSCIGDDAKPHIKAIRYDIVDLDPKWQHAPPSVISNELLGSLNCEFAADLIMIIVSSVLEIASGVTVIMVLN